MLWAATVRLNGESADMGMCTRIVPEYHEDRHWVYCQSGLQRESEAHGRTVLFHELLVKQVRGVHRVPHHQTYFLHEYHARMCSDKSRFQDDLALVVKALRCGNAKSGRMCSRWSALTI